MYERQTAYDAGLTIYIAEKPCKRGHVPHRRYVSTGQCVECARRYQNAFNIKKNQRRILGEMGWRTAVIDGQSQPIHAKDIDALRVHIDCLAIARDYTLEMEADAALAEQRARPVPPLPAEVRRMAEQAEITRRLTRDHV